MEVIIVSYSSCSDGALVHSQAVEKSAGPRSTYVKTNRFTSVLLQSSDGTNDSALTTEVLSRLPVRFNAARYTTRGVEEEWGRPVSGHSGSRRKQGHRT